MSEKYKTYILSILACVLFIRIMQYSWVTDDAFITFRSVFNFISGHGPVFNIGERVQSFTHPLWFLLLSLGGALDLNLYFFAILLGLLCSALTIFSLFKLQKALSSDRIMSVLSFITLIASESYISFSTSGLENALTFLIFANVVLAALDPAQRFKFYLLVALALLNRFDSIFILAPLTLWITYIDFRNKNLRLHNVIFGGLPLIIWHSFSLIYYGFLFPNTKYAKVGGRSISENIDSGINYLLDSFQAEWHVVFLIAFLFFVAINSLLSNSRNVQHKSILVALVAGIVMHILYVIFISGGDFMRGRFITNIVFVCSLCLLFIKFSNVVVSRPTFYLPSGALIAVLFCISGWIGAKEHIHTFSLGVANERNFYKETLGMNLEPQKSYFYHPWAIQARDLKWCNEAGILGVTGQRGYWIPTSVNLIDPVALTDAFIARLPISDNKRTGHFHHTIPSEYIEMKVSHRNIDNWQDPETENLYRRIKLVTESPELFSINRFKSMVWLWVHYGI